MCEAVTVPNLMMVALIVLMNRLLGWLSSLMFDLQTKNEWTKQSQNKNIISMQKGKYQCHMAAYAAHTTN